MGSNKAFMVSDGNGSIESPLKLFENSISALSSPSNEFNCEVGNSFVSCF